jgi:hypothetical protein
MRTVFSPAFEQKGLVSERLVGVPQLIAKVWFWEGESLEQQRVPCEGEVIESIGRRHRVKVFSLIQFLEVTVALQCSIRTHPTPSDQAVRRECL